MDKLMRQKEVKRGQILDLLENDKISQKEATKRVGVSPRQVRRLLKRYHAEGLCGLASKKCGSASNRRLDETTRATVVKLIGTHYWVFGPTLAREKFASRHDIQLSAESTRQMMIEAGYWHTL